MTEFHIGKSPMKYHRLITALIVMGAIALVVTSCRKKPLEKLYGTWTGTSKIDQDITITLRPDSTIEIETEADSVRQVRKGTYQIVDRRLRIVLKSVETYTGDSVRREMKNEHDEAVFTLTYDDELVLRRGAQVLVLHRVPR